MISNSTFKVFLILIVSAIFLGGCAVDNPMEPMTDTSAKINITDADGNEYSIDPVSYATKLEAARFDDCMAFKREQEEDKWNQVARLDAAALSEYLEKDQWKDALLGINGKDQCSPGTNLFDAYIAYAKSTGKVYEVAMSETGKTLRFGLGIWGANSIAESIFDAVSGHTISSQGGDIEIVDSMNEEKQVILQNSDGNATATPTLDKSSNQEVPEDETVEEEVVE